MGILKAIEKVKSRNQKIKFRREGIKEYWNELEWYAGYAGISISEFGLEEGCLDKQWAKTVDQSVHSITPFPLFRGYRGYHWSWLAGTNFM